MPAAGDEQSVLLQVADIDVEALAGHDLVERREDVGMGGGGEGRAAGERENHEEGAAVHARRDACKRSIFQNQCLHADESRDRHDGGREHDP